MSARNLPTTDPVGRSARHIGDRTARRGNKSAQRRYAIATSMRYDAPAR